MDIIDQNENKLDTSVLIDEDQQRNLDVVLFSMDFRLEASMLLRKIFFAYLMEKSAYQIDRYKVIEQIMKHGELNVGDSRMISISLKDYQNINYENLLIKSQNDRVKFMWYDKFLNKKGIQITTNQFSKLLECSIDYVFCDETNLKLVQYLMIDFLLTFKPFQYFEYARIKNQIENMASLIKNYEIGKISSDGNKLKIYNGRNVCF
ncbi:UNKNOWN [Stylonychia lemnae]|uniref:Uncharacterized protein n=1 Tax=Stylonychia lemnae TaxID=5949 RepID=A0A078A1Z9_STYLE|nr:UNKNOWN [Stylonychia lemnae]|eukprot:CDW76261.1 UNKNOWN [Stylonychia lemnae]